MWGMETVGIETVGIETLGRLDGSHPDTLPVTLENIPPDAFVGLRERRMFYCIINRSTQSPERAFIRIYGCKNQPSAVAFGFIDLSAEAKRKICERAHQSV